MRFLRLAGLVPALAILASPAAVGETAPPESPYVVVDYCRSSDSYRVVGDVALLSQRYTPGSTLQLIIGAVGLESGELTETTQIPCRTDGSGSGRATPVSLPRALRESNAEFFSQLARRTGYEPIRRLLVEARFVSAVPDAVNSFADLARGEPLRITVFEQNLFLQAFARGALPLRVDTRRTLERSLAVDADKPAWGTVGLGEFSSDPPRYVSWFNGVARLRDGPHVITVAALSHHQEPVALEQFRRYLARPRR
jgi:beta-lactamase class D